MLSYSVVPRVQNHKGLHMAPLKTPDVHPSGRISQDGKPCRRSVISHELFIWGGGGGGGGGVGVWGGARVVRYRMPCLVEGNLFSPSQVALHVVRGEA